MFSSVGLFKNVPCPKRHECALPQCIFGHVVPDSPEASTGVTALGKEYDPFSAGDVAEPAPKRRRIDSLDQENEAPTPRASQPNNPRSTTPKPSPSTVAQGAFTGRQSNDPVNNALPKPPSLPRQLSKASPTTIKRPISPPPARQVKNSLPPASKRELKVEPLTPRNVAKAPAVFKTRLAVLQALHKQVLDQNKKLATAADSSEDAVLTDQEAITYALDEEELATSLGEDLYRNNMAQKVLRIKKMNTADWVQKVREWKSPVRIEGKDSGLADSVSLLGLSSTEEIAVLPYLRTPLEGLEKYGYVTKPPSAGELSQTKAALASAGGYEVCDRCGTRFQVFPGRDEEGNLTSHGACRHHWAKLNRAQTSKATRILGQSEATFPCCGQAPGSEGCTEGETHVFIVKDPKRLSLILPFESTPEAKDNSSKHPVAFDCEMGYTTLGMEIIRLTAVKWPSNELILDFLVRPYGEILDLNTRFSGVTKEAYADAVEYQPGEDISHSPNLRKVASPAAARQALFNHLTPTTPLIGHAIDNDLNVCRIIHRTVIDTVLLYPHPRGLPYRQSLKQLAQRVLGRGIQMGGATGHDSKEDSMATGDLVRRKVADKWSLMYHEGWRFVNGTPKAPGSK